MVGGLRCLLFGWLVGVLFTGLLVGCFACSLRLPVGWMVWLFVCLACWSVYVDLLVGWLVGWFVCSFVWLFVGLLVGWLVTLLVGLLVGWLVGWFVGWLVARLVCLLHGWFAQSIGWLVGVVFFLLVGWIGRWFECSFGWFVAGLVGWFVGWLHGWLHGLLHGWLHGWWHGWLVVVVSICLVCWYFPSGCLVCLASLLFCWFVCLCACLVGWLIVGSCDGWLIVWCIA